MLLKQRDILLTNPASFWPCIVKAYIQSPSIMNSGAGLEFFDVSMVFIDQHHCQSDAMAVLMEKSPSLHPWLFFFCHLSLYNPSPSISHSLARIPGYSSVFLGRKHTTEICALKHMWLPGDWRRVNGFSCGLLLCSWGVDVFFFFCLSSITEQELSVIDLRCRGNISEQFTLALFHHLTGIYYSRLAKGSWQHALDRQQSGDEGAEWVKGKWREERNCKVDFPFSN